VAFAQRHDASEDQIDTVRSAVSEAVSNAVIHAYRSTPGEVHITAAVTSGELWVLVADDGCGFQTPAESPGLGWGLALIAHAAEDFVLAERAEGGTEARMRFRIGGSL
jgi:anti-sigma regulatory factor (Ser/Thr protein kinase)